MVDPPPSADESSQADDEGLRHLDLTHEPVPDELVVRMMPTSIQTVHGDVIMTDVQYDKTRRPWGSASAMRMLQQRQTAAAGSAFESMEEAYLSLIGLADLNAIKTQKSAVRWSRTHYYLGLPAALTATVSGATGLASIDLRVEAAIIALVSAALAAAVTFLASQANRDKNNALSASWSSLADDARLELYQIAKMREPEKSEAGLKRFVALKQRKDALARGTVPGPEAPAGQVG